MGARKNLVIAAALVFAASLAACRGVDLPVLNTLGDFRLVDQTGAPFGSPELRGKVWVANFVFTRCTDVCPRFTERMVGFAERTAKLGDALHLVSFSVDPGYDTPPVLAAYASAHHATDPRWSFLTGTVADVQRTVTDGLKTAMDRNPRATDPGTSILHGRHFVLVDRDLRIRGFYDSNDEQAVAKLIEDASALAK